MAWCVKIHNHISRMKYSYKTCGTCSRQIDIDYDATTGTINDVKFTGGCNGNTQGVAALVKGRKAAEVIGIIKGIKCGNKSTSCPDQLATALEQVSAQTK